jgi:hypothetical protein
MAEFKFRITKKIAVLSGDEKYGVEFNRVKWGDMEPLYDIRKWRNGVPVKGISLNEAEAKALLAALEKELKK